MPYIQRNSSGAIVALLREPGAATNGEFLPSSHPDVCAFLAEGSEGDVQIALQASDADLARVTEDLIHLLVEKNLILFTELPAIVQEKLALRERLRAKLRPDGTSIVSEDDTL